MADAVLRENPLPDLDVATFATPTAIFQGDDWVDSFEFGPRRVLDGIEVLVTARPAR